MSNNAINCNPGDYWLGIKNVKNNQIGNINCGSAVLNDNVNGVKKGTKIDDSCDCEDVTITSNTVTCPLGKFLVDYRPLQKKAKCCSICTKDKTIKSNVDVKKCNNMFFKTSEPANCPPQNFVRGLSLTDNTTKLECCSPSFISSTTTPKETDEMKMSCDKLGLQDNNCKQNNVKDLIKKCNELGLGICNVSSVNEIQNKCGEYGFRYIDDNDKVVNSFSPYICHIDNFGKLEKECMLYGVKECTIENLTNAQKTFVKVLQTDIDNMNKIQEIYYKKLDSFLLKSMLNNPYLASFIFFILLTLIIIITSIIIK